MLDKLVRSELSFDSSTHIWSKITSKDKKGLTSRYTTNALQDAASFTNYVHPYSKIREIISQDLHLNSHFRVLDVASGFGNTVIPLLRDFQNSTVIATDLSSSMLKILSETAQSLGFRERLHCLEIDARDLNIFFPQSFDLVIGGAALHHFIDPESVLSTCLNLLYPGGIALFFEPMELGLTIFALALKESLPLIQKNKHPDAAGAHAFFKGLIKDIEYRSRRFTDAFSPRWEDLDDKWVFTRDFFESIALNNYSSIEILPLHSQKDVFLSHAQICLKLYGGIQTDGIFTDEIIETFRLFESKFSSQAIKDIPIEASIKFSRNLTQ